MKRIILQACCLLLFSWLFAHRASAQQADSVATLASRIDTLLKYKLPAGAHAGLCIYDLTAGRMLYEYQADKLSRPASTMKVMTAITALSQQGIDEPFRTELWTRGRIVGDTLKGDLYVVGGFDPELDETDLKELIGGLTKRGIRFALLGNGLVVGRHSFHLSALPFAADAQQRCAASHAAPCRTWPGGTSRMQSGFYLLYYR